MKASQLVLTPKELSLIEIAVRLRAESAEDNKETKDAKKWRALLEKIQGAGNG